MSKRASRPGGAAASVTSRVTTAGFSVIVPVVIIAAIGAVGAVLSVVPVTAVNTAGAAVPETTLLSSASLQTGSVWDGAYTEAQARRGEPLYEASCAECHGSDLNGLEMAPGLLGSEFAWNWNGLTLGDLFERVRVSMPQGAPTSVSRGEKADILAYMLEVNGFPAGETELGSRTDTLRGVSFHAEKP